MIVTSRGWSAVSFNRDIRPIMAETCFNCHGPDAKARKADLRLDTFEGATRQVGGAAAIVPGKPDLSLVLERVLSTDESEVMPPPEFPIELTSQQKNLIRQWIAEGAKYEGHWAFARIERPEEMATDWGHNPIDGFIAGRLKAKGLKPNARADRASLIRRASLDLTGLPPKPAEIDAFEQDVSPDAYEQLIDRLLKSERFGERMAMWWLDGARYADSHGFQADWERYQWPWRDWVIGAFNRNLPFDQFTVEQLAGDLLPDATRDQIVATGFNRNHRINTEGGSLDAEWLVENVIDRVETMGAVWLGLTLNCARCHDHKYDPISQKEFYQFFAYFHNIPEKGKGPGKQGNFDPILKLPTPAMTERIASLEKQKSENDKSLRLLQKQMPKRMQEWEAQRVENSESKEPQWRELSNDEVVSEGGATFKELEDGSWLASGKNPSKDVYEITGSVGRGVVTAVKLSAIPHSSMRGKGVGRASNGNFLMTDIKLFAGERPVKIDRTFASFEQANWPIKHAIDDKEGTGWAVEGNKHKVQREALFILTEAQQLAEGESFVAKLSFKSKYGSHAIGRLRLKVTSHRSPALDGAASDEKKLFAALKASSKKRNKVQKELIKSSFLREAGKDIAGAEKALEKVRKNLETERKKVPTVMVMQEMVKPRTSHILNRGQYDQPRDPVQAGVPSAFSPFPKGAPNNRLGLARWIVGRDNPLTARVQVNRLWELLFGIGLVKTSEDFGVQAEWPSHPELLDWLAAEFIESGWDVKGVLKTMMLSEAYQQSAAILPEKLRTDPANRLVSRGPRFRVQAEIIRDQALYVAGLLHETIGGPSVRPYQPAGIWSEFNFYGNLRNYKHDKDSGLYRRSLYTIWKRTAAPPGMTLFDMPNREICTVKRPRTNTPLQALALMNDVTFTEASRVLAQRMIRSGKDLDTQLMTGFRWVTSRRPSVDQLHVLRRGHERRLLLFQKSPDEAFKLIEQGESKPDAKIDPVQLAAMTSSASIL
ncbi:MAG: PSD1 and planctomycete cytochrome C domain-containing protein [Limisphaerales bacterium]